MTASPDSAVGIPSWQHLAVVVLVCGLVYWPMLGTTGLSSSEGHRVIPGWEMLETGDFLVTRMFEQIYVRKPPGMPWAVALFSSVLGQTEFAARAVSAASMTALALLTAFFAARWFGRRWALWGGLGAALMPMLWSSGRSAEIEALNNFATAAAAMLLIDLLVNPRRRQVLVALAAAGAIGLMTLAKGPAGFTTIGAALLASCIVLRSARPLANRYLWGALALPAAALLGLFVMIKRAVEQSPQAPVVEDVSNFTWGDRGFGISAVADVLAMPPTALLTALPTALILLFIWKPTMSGHIDQRADQIARAIGLTCLLSLGMLAAAGISNPRYAMPATVVLPVLAAYFARGAWGGFSGSRRTIAQALLPMRGSVWLIGLLIGAAYFVLVYQHDQRTLRSGIEAGQQLSHSLPDGAVVWADQLIEARPEVLFYAGRAAAGEGRTVRMRWMPGFAWRGQLPPAGAYALVRTDARATEMEALQRSLHRFEPIAEGTVHIFDFVLYRVLPE